MSVIPWSPRYAIGIKQIDEQHEHLFFLLNRLYYDFINGTSGQTLDSLIDELIDYATYHFATEEYRMKQARYPKLEEHKGSHAIFSLRIGEIAKSHCGGGRHISLELLSFLHNWLSTHILDVDTDFGRFIAKAQPGLAAKKTD